MFRCSQDVAHKQPTLTRCGVQRLLNIVAAPDDTARFVSFCANGFDVRQLMTRWGLPLGVPVHGATWLSNFKGGPMV